MSRPAFARYTILVPVVKINEMEEIIDAWNMRVEGRAFDTRGVGRGNGKSVIRNQPTRVVRRFTDEELKYIFTSKKDKRAIAEALGRPVGSIHCALALKEQKYKDAAKKYGYTKQ